MAASKCEQGRSGNPVSDDVLRRFDAAGGGHEVGVQAMGLDANITAAP
jgi:hypothetical protein